MRTLTFIAITLFSGAIAGAILGIINQSIVEPFVQQAIDIENQNAIAAGELFNPSEYAAYRIWQRGGEIAAGTVLGLSIGALFGIVFAYARSSLPGSNNKKKALILAGIMWLALFLVPALKYPANPPAVGDPETIYYRQNLYLAFVAISGFSALSLAFLYRKIGSPVQAKKAILPAAYVAIMAAAFVVMPANPDQISAPTDLVVNFRIASAFTMSVFWGLLGMMLGSFWDKLKPHEAAEIKAR
jgi:predicted cobalt transporter CbtA